MLATLSRWRPWVQIPSGAPRLNVKADGTVRKPAKRPSSNLGDLWVRLPLVPWLIWVVFLTAACKAVAINCEAVGERFNSFTTHFLFLAPWSTGQDTTLSRWRRGFDSLPEHTRTVTDCYFPRRDRRPIGSHKVDLPGSIPGPGTLRAGWCSAEFHRLGGRGSNPGPAIQCE